MHIQSVRIQNFRCFQDQTIEFDNYTCFVGANGAGKSTVFNALNVFFRQYKDAKTDLSKLTKDDFHHKNTEVPIRITVTFGGLTDNALEDLAAYARQDKLIVTAVATYDMATERAEVKQFGSRLVVEAFKVFFEQEKAGAKAPELNATYAKLREQFPELPAASSKDAKIEAFRQYENEHPDQCALLESEDEFYGVSRGANRLSAHIQWVFVPAVKDAGEESEESRTSALGLLLARTVRSKVNFKERLDEIAGIARTAYNVLLDENQEALEGISTSIEERLATWAHPDISAKVKWTESSDKSVKIDEPSATIRVSERGFEGGLVRFGHGMQRSYLFALLQMLAANEDDSAPTLVMCIEEPELFQHPPQARYLAETLLELADAGKSQILVCTHSPFFIPGDGFQHTRIARETGSPSATTISSLSYTALAEKLAQIGEKPLKAQGLMAKLWPAINPITSEMYFCKVLILVEGYEDVAYIKSYLHLSGLLHEFRRYGCHIVPAMGKSCIIHPLAIASLLNIPAFVVWDADINSTKDDHIREHKRDNRAILNLLELPDFPEWPGETLRAANMTVWETNMGNAIESDFEPSVYAAAKDEAINYFGNAGGLQKSPLKIIKHMELLWQKGHQSPTLIKLVVDIIAFAKARTTQHRESPTADECLVDDGLGSQTVAQADKV